MSTPSITIAHLFSRYGLGGVIWLLGWMAIIALSRKLDINNLGMVLVLTSALASVCLPMRISLLLGVVSELALDWFFIPPKGTLVVDFYQHALMLIVIFVVNIIIVSLMAIQRNQSERAARHASEAELLRAWSDRLHQAQSPYQQVDALQTLLAEITGQPVALLVLSNEMPATDDNAAAIFVGNIGIEQRHALWHCMRNSQQLGRGTGRYEHFSDVYLPLRTRGHAVGAALLANFAVHEFSTRVHLQAICDQLGGALERYRAQQQELNSREQVQAQLIKNSLLAAISHDYRTPLATIMGAASSLYVQTEKLTQEQQNQLAHRIYDEAERLNTITSNILQLSHLDANHKIVCDWQSAEEILADLIRRWRGRNLAHRLNINLATNLPLLWCDAILIGQLLENLVDNALKYSPVDTTVDIDVSVEKNDCVFTVSDKGNGIPEQWREKIFEPFQRGPSKNNGHPIVGAGVGLALCRAIALAHQGNLNAVCPESGGSKFILRFPLRELPTNINNISRDIE